MKFGITGSLNNLNLYRASMSENFQTYANENLLSNAAKNAIDEAKQNGFINKGISKKTQAFKQKIIDIKQDNYDGKWYESGWYKENPVKAIFFHYPNNGSVIYERANLPYTTQSSTGVYINLTWSGYEHKFDNEKYVVGGYIDYAIDYDPITQTGYVGDLTDFPYRNVYEIFDHKNIQVGDMGYNLFLLPELGYPQDSEIGYNKIFFQSGLNKDNINENTKILIFPSTKMQLNKNYRYTINGKRLSFQENLNDIRYFVFFYTGKGN